MSDKLPDESDWFHAGILKVKVIRVRPEIRSLVERGNVTQTELNELRCNSWEWEALVPAMTDEAFVGSMWHALENCFTPTTRPFVTYNKAVEGLYAPELLKRFKRSLAFDQVDQAREAAEVSGILMCAMWLEKKGHESLAKEMCRETSREVRDHWIELRKAAEVKP